MLKKQISSVEAEYRPLALNVAMLTWISFFFWYINFSSVKFLPFYFIMSLLYTTWKKYIEIDYHFVELVP